MQRQCGILFHPFPDELGFTRVNHIEREANYSADSIAGSSLSGLHVFHSELPPLTRACLRLDRLDTSTIRRIIVKENPGVNPDLLLHVPGQICASHNNRRAALVLQGINRFKLERQSLITLLIGGMQGIYATNAIAFESE